MPIVLKTIDSTETHRAKKNEAHLMLNFHISMGIMKTYANVSNKFTSNV